MFGQYAAFIIPSYAVSAIAIIAMTLIIKIQHRTRKRELSDLEERGLKRRSDS